MSASVIESIRFEREPGHCEHGGDHSKYMIRWTNPDGAPQSRHVYWCRHPLCDASETPWLSISRPHVKLTAWIPGIRNAIGGAPVATAYLLVLTGVREQRIVTEMQARIGICSQWQDGPSVGNGGEPGGRLFTERYFAESGPGVYPATIEIVR